MQIGNLRLKNNVFLAPMAGVTDIAFRELCIEQGCGLVYTEMISSKALFYGNSKTEHMFDISEKEKPCAVQIFGSEPDIMAKTCEIFNFRDDICLVDINMGCPAPKIVKNGDGSALMKTPDIAEKIVKAVKKESLKPVTVKMRIGFDSEHINVLDFAKRIEQAGADAITVHGRTSKQMYTGTADWNIISKVKNMISIPVIGNGDIKTADEAQYRLDMSKCDGIMIGRGAMGNPWIFKQIRQKRLGKKVKYPTDIEKIDLCIDHYRRSIKYKGQRRALLEMRKHMNWYLKGLEASKEIKDKINCEDSIEKVIEILETYKNFLY
ncbi:tRNA dihydrouridine synthase DusB [Clostridium tyrobutyricum]|uniref:tRNA dihydrouridine synthase DusB n=1 Tax=Clostridium tyrobutyricum TaxID=1519 RepID=UPI001C395BA4|nr:tRNA dihydrouridine synthase DusB [Clostridium tyrobutyricum]MBV4429030.1 tRNA dihydrouridine synthase DusB [Clostridium tyrobutyricum]MBV4444070.1 tRNA dihydrouridine synthase DusB [Clostridium tyrobutyricum]